jgi:hypothetical protein
MGWVKICKDNQKYLVTKEIYDSVFKYQGYRIENANEGSTQNPIKSSDMKSMGVSNELLTKPTSRANKIKPATKV